MIQGLLTFDGKAAAARAMRETMHSATREGVDVAVGRMEAQGQGIIGTAIPVAEHAAAQ